MHKYINNVKRLKTLHREKKIITNICLTVFSVAKKNERNVYKHNYYYSR